MAAQGAATGFPSLSGSAPTAQGTRVERRMRRVAQRMLGVRFHARHPPARAGQPGHLGSYLGGRGKVDQQRAGVHQVKRARRQPGAPGVGRDDLHAAQPPPGGKLDRHGGMRRI